MYGLRQAGREWSNLLSSFLIKWGFVRSTIDVCLYSYQRIPHITLLVIVWVDDCIIADNDSSLRSRFVKDLGKAFPIENKGDIHWVLQVKVTRDRKQSSLVLSQQLYIQDLANRFGHLINENVRRFDSPCDPSAQFSQDQCPCIESQEYEDMAVHRDEYMSMVGAFLWLANVTRFEIGYIAAQLARHFLTNQPIRPIS